MPSELLDPSKLWTDKEGYKTALKDLAVAFIKNSEKFKSHPKAPQLLAGGPQLK